MSRIPFDTDFQKLVMVAYKAAGTGDDSLVQYMKARFGAGSDSTLSDWRRGHVTMPLDALESILDHTGIGTEATGKILTRLFSRWGFRAVRDTAAQPTGEGMASELLDIVEQTGGLAAVVKAARSDGHIDDAEAQKIEEAADALAQQVAELRALVGARANAFRKVG